MISLDRGPEYIKRVEGLYREAEHLQKPVDRLVSTYQIGKYLQRLKERQHQ